MPKLSKFVADRIPSGWEERLFPSGLRNHSGVKIKKEYSPVEEKGFIYVIKCKEFYKIGRTMHQNKIENRYKTHSPFLCELIFCIPCSNVISFEKYIHRIFNDKRHQGEWFCLSTADLEFIRSNALSIMPSVAV